MTRIAVLGLGAMGARMARRLLDGGHDLTVYNRTAARAEPLVAAGAKAAATPREAVADAEVVLTMLTDDDAARAVWLDEDSGIVAGLSDGAVAVECSTVTPTWISTLGAALAARDAPFLDAPVVGSRPQAEAGQLIFVVGGDAGTLAEVEPLLALMGSAVHLVGPTGAGAWMKLAVNSLFAAQAAVVGELLGLLKRAGLPPEQAMNVLGALPVTSPAAKGVGGLMVADRHAPLFPTDLVEKDLRYTLAAAAETRAKLPAVDAVRRIYAEAQEAGHGALNISGIGRPYLA